VMGNGADLRNYTHAIFIFAVTKLKDFYLCQGQGF